MSEIFLSIIVPTFKGIEHLATCLPALISAAGTAGFEYEILVVDDCSPDETSRWVRAHHPAARLVRHDINKGFASACNTGIRQSRGIWVALVNDDVIVEPDWISQAFAGNVEPDCGAIATQIVFDRSPSTINSAGDRYASCGVAVQRLRDRNVSEDTGTERCFSACAAACFYRRSALEKVGPFRECLGAYYEDVDLGFRLNLAGYHCRYVRLSRCRHQESASYGRRSWRVLYNSARNREIVFFSNMPGGLLIKFLPGHLAIIFLQLVWSIGAGGFFPKALGTLAAIGRTGQIIELRSQSRAITAVDLSVLQKIFWRRWFNGLVLSRLKSSSILSVRGATA